MIRPYREADAQHLAPIHTAVFPHNPLSKGAFHNHVSSLLTIGASAWIIERDTPFGYALIVPVPGLLHIADLKGCIAPARQRQGFGTALLGRVLNDLQGMAVRQLSHALHDLDSPSSHFLQKHGFYIEHQECLLGRDSLSDLPRPQHSFSPTITTLPRSQAIDTFAGLFAAAFAGLPWDQPYTRSEITAVLGHPNNILFLTVNASPIGFAWLHLQADGLAAIEPLGILPAYQGQGYGRYLLLFALHELAHRGATRAQIGAWRTNQPAIHLYQSLGFAPHKTITYLAKDLPALK